MKIKTSCCKLFYIYVFKSNFPVPLGHVWSCQMLKFLGIFVWSSSVHVRGLRRYFNPSWYLKSIILYTPYDLAMLHATFKKVIDLHPCFSHLTNFLEFISTCVFLHPCYLGFVTSFKNINLFVKFMKRVWQTI